MKTVLAIIFAAVLAFASEGDIKYGVRTGSVKTASGYIGTYQFPDTTLTIRFAKHAVSHVRYDFATHTLYTNSNDAAKDGTVVPPPPNEPKMQEIRQWNP